MGKDKGWEEMQDLKKARKQQFGLLKRWPVLRKGVYLYLLRDYYTGEIRYVGQTVNPLSRMRIHMIAMKWFSEPFSDWKRQHYFNGVIPKMEIIAIVESKVATQQEMALIQNYVASGVRLFNTVKQSR